MKTMYYTKKMQYVEALEEEQKKIQVFQRELPLCLELVTQAIESCRKELITSEEYVNGHQSECSDRTTSDCGGVAVFEEFIPIKVNSSSTLEPEKIVNENNVDNKKSDWLRSVQLWNQSPDPHLKEDLEINKKAATVVEVKRSGAFQPFQKEKSTVVKGESQPFKSISPTSSSTVETVKRESEQQKQSHRKQRRCWSPELHRRFLHALQQLGGSHVATPKQIKDLMNVDDLTNDEVKSHLQKYRLHTRRPATPAVTNGGENPQQQQFMVVEGIWVPSHDATKNTVYSPVAEKAPQCSPSGERNSRRCKSPATSSTHTPHLLPLS